MFSQSREHRARFMDAVAVILLLLTMAFLGVVVYAASAHADPDDPEVIAYASHYASAVCSTLSDYPTLNGLQGILNAVEDDGLSARQSGEAVAMSVIEVCPQYTYLIKMYIAKYTPAAA